MGLHLSRRGYTVRVDGTLMRDSRFVIRAEIAYAAHLSDEEWMRLSPMAQLELLLGIEGVEMRGRSLGADVPIRSARPAGSRRAGLFGRGEQPGLALGPVEEA
jgi:hypothetical protein